METSGTEAYEFVRACISHGPEAARRETLQSFLEAGGNWEDIFRTATRHSVRPLFGRNLERLLGSGLSPSLRDRIRKSQWRNRIHANFLVQELGKICRLCEEHDLPVLTMKGPVLAQVAYGDIAMRRYVDLDVLIPKERFSEFDHLLRTEGYEYPKALQNIKGWRRTLSHSLSGQWQFSRAAGAFNLDVHTRVMPPGYSFPVDFEPFWERSREIQLRDDVSVRGLSPEDMALVLSYHGVKNQWRSLKYVADLAELVQFSLNWSSLIERAREIRSTRVLRLGMRLAHDLLDVTFPAEVQKWTRGSPMDDVISMLKDYLRSRDRRRILSFGKRVRLQRATKDTVADQLRYGAYSMMQHFWSTVLKP